jgi:hypothetical protein
VFDDNDFVAEEVHGVEDKAPIVSDARYVVFEGHQSVCDVCTPGVDDKALLGDVSGTGFRFCAPCRAFFTLN